MSIHKSCYLWYIVTLAVVLHHQFLLTSSLKNTVDNLHVAVAEDVPDVLSREISRREPRAAALSLDETSSPVYDSTDEITFTLIAKSDELTTLASPCYDCSTVDMVNVTTDGNTSKFNDSTTSGTPPGTGRISPVTETVSPVSGITLQVTDAVSLKTSPAETSDPTNASTSTNSTPTVTTDSSNGTSKTSLKTSSLDPSTLGTSTSPIMVSKDLTERIFTETVNATTENWDTTINATELITHVSTDFFNDSITEFSTKTVSEVVTQDVSEVVTENVTETNTAIVTEFLTEFTEIITDNITESTTEFMTVNFTEYVTENFTTFFTENVTAFVTGNITQLATDSTPTLATTSEYNSTESPTNGSVPSTQSLNPNTTVTSDELTSTAIPTSSWSTNATTDSFQTTESSTQNLTNQTTPLLSTTEVKFDTSTPTSSNVTSTHTWNPRSTMLSTTQTRNLTTFVASTSPTTDIVATTNSTNSSTSLTTEQTQRPFTNLSTTASATTAIPTSRAQSSVAISLTTEQTQRLSTDLSTTSSATTAVTTSQRQPSTLPTTSRRTTEADPTPLLTTETTPTILQTDRVTTNIPSTLEPTTRFRTTTLATTRLATEPWLTTMPVTERPVDDELKDLLEEPITEDNVEEVAEELAELTEDAEDMTADGVDTTAEILENITALNSSEPQVTTAVVETVSNLMAVSEEELQSAAEDGATNRAVQALESQLMFVNVSATNGTYKDVQENVGVQVTEYSPGDLDAGLTFLYATNDPDGPLKPDEIVVIPANDENVTMSEVTTQARLTLPSSLGSRIDGNITRVSFVVYRTTSMFLSSWYFDYNEKNPDFTRNPNTRIISATVNGVPIANLLDPVEGTFLPLVNSDGENVTNVTNPLCVSWDFEADDGRGNWTQKGCYLVESDDVDELMCHCNHLTNFAILMDIHGGTTLTSYQDFVLEVMSYVGCCLSIVCLTVTLATFLTTRSLRKLRPNKILMSLSASLLCLYTVFIVLLSVNRVSMVICGVIVGLLHFSLLMALCWMAVESLNIYLMVIKVFVQMGLEHFMLKAAIFAIGTPAVIVGIAAGVARTDYMSYNVDTQQCGFLNKWPLVGAVLVPIATIIIYDTIVFTMVMRRLSQRVDGKRMTRPKYKENLQRVQHAVGFIIVMGTTWIFGFLTSIEAATVAFQIIFIIFNSLQGVFIFLFYCFRRPAIRAKWRKALCCCLPPPKDSTSTASTGESHSRSRSQSHPLADSHVDFETSEEKAVKWYQKFGRVKGFYDLTSKNRNSRMMNMELSSESASTVVIAKSKSYGATHVFGADTNDDSFHPSDAQRNFSEMDCEESNFGTL
ncbi:uncharacterized protein [Diadema antillarum]|uniref:uncharacterized protein n=1 Tax=Diadema antillarum TaxID=105358 RepID=UPI003A8BE4A8